MFTENLYKYYSNTATVLLQILRISTVIMRLLFIINNPIISMSKDKNKKTDGKH